MNKRWFYVLLCAVIFSSSPVLAAGPAQTAALVTPGEATLKDVPVVLRAVGSVAPSATVTVKSRISGELIEVLFTEGQMVKEGELLFVIDKKPNEIAVREVEAKLEADKASLAKAEADLTRSQTLVKGGFTSAEQNQQAMTLVATLRAAIKADEAGIARARLNLSYCDVTAPMSGRVGDLLVDKGNYVTNDSLVIIDAIKPVTVTFSVPERYVTQIRELSQKGDLPVQAATPEGKPVLGVLTFLGNVDNKTGTVPLKATFQNADVVLWPGEFVNIQLQLEVLNQVVAVPSRAVVIGPNGTFVYVVTPDMKAEYRLVKTGIQEGGLTVITEGLKAGETVVLEGHVRLAPGVTVRLAATAPAGAASDAAKAVDEKGAGARS